MSFRDNNLTINKNENKIPWMLLFVVPVIIYFYFLKWKTDAIYGDDLYIYKHYLGLHSFSDKIDMPVSFGKYRPIHGLSMHLIIEWFQKNLTGYYIFNVSIQAINSFILAMIVNLFLRSPYLSLLFGLIIGLTRFSFFNISQLFNGGALEGLAITFFLLSLLLLLKALKIKEYNASENQRHIWFAILFANLSMYTHERYVVVFPFIILIILFSPTLRILSGKTKVFLILGAVMSIIINVLIKKYIYGMPFFVGTGGTNIDVSISASIGYFTEAILSIFQINQGPEYLVGISFPSLPLRIKISVILLVTGFILLLGVYIGRVWKSFALKQKDGINDFLTFFFLGSLFILLLAPAVVTIRLEQRWLQGSLIVFIIMMVIALSGLNFKNRVAKNAILCVFAVLFLWIDYNYLNRGAASLYMSSAENLAMEFKEAIDDGVVRPQTSKLYIWEKQKDANTENTIQWTLGHGYLFEFYQDSTKQMIFVDSIYERSGHLALDSFKNFDKKDAQIVYIGKDVIDITNDYLEDTLKNFTTYQIKKLTSDGNIQYDQRTLLITNDDFDKFAMSGFYDNENGIRWTDGNASIGFMGEYIATGTLNFELRTYMPPICKDIIPQISITDEANTTYSVRFIKREGDQFSFKIHFEKLTGIQKINIVADTIIAPSDARRLSFPFISLELRK